jgi:hypothetical protein
MPVTLADRSGSRTSGIWPSVDVMDLFPYTQLTEPPMDAGEAEILRFALDRSRAQFAWKAGALDAAALRRRHEPSAITLGGLVKHLALCEDLAAARVSAQPPPAVWKPLQDAPDTGWEWHSAGEDSPDELYRLWSEAVERNRAAFDALVAGSGLDAATVWLFPSGAQPPNARRVLVDLHDEYARHVGHADLLREAIDGLTGEDPPQGAPQR